MTVASSFELWDSCFKIITNTMTHVDYPLFQG